MIKTTRILVVDDDAAIVQMLADLLQAHGYEVCSASTGQQGLQAARQRPPELVLIDVRLPDVPGPKVCSQIKTDPLLQDVFVALMSGTAKSVADKVGGLEAGADDYFVKPFNLDELLARIRTIVRLRDTTAALRASEQHYRQLVELLPEAIGTIDPQGRLLALNTAGASILGYGDPAELLGKSVYDFTPETDRDRLRAEIAVALQGGAFRDIQHTVLGKSARFFPAELSAAVLKDAEGRPSGLVGVMRDITERQQILQTPELLT
jgi:PAS domain S-box-containing protein